MLRTTKLVCALGAIAALSGALVTPKLQMAERIDQVDVVAREPIVVEGLDGTLFVSGYGADKPSFWKSVDHGKTWNRVNVGTEAEGAVGDSDVDLAVAADGTLYCLNMTFDNKKLEGTQIAVGVSRDSGAHWTWRTLSKNRFEDRPWVAVASDGTAHVTWNDAAVFGIRRAATSGAHGLSRCA